jgi:hypothetical protein
MNSSLVLRIRRNHGLEHATLHILAARYPRLPLAGHSDWRGFWIIGDIATDELAGVVIEALQRLRNGERRLAVHPNCGTNWVTSGIFAGLAGAAAMLGSGPRFRSKLERLPLAASLATVALIAAQPLGLRIQERFTVSGDPGPLRIVEVFQVTQGRYKAHRVLTQA